MSSADIIQFPRKPKVMPPLNPVAVTSDLMERIRAMQVEREALRLGPFQSQPFSDPMASIRAVAAVFGDD